MKKKELETTSLEERKVGGVGTLATAALVGALSLLSPSEGSAKTVSSIDEGAKVTEVTQQKQEMSTRKAIHLSDLETGCGTGIKSGEDEPIKFEPDPDLGEAKIIKVKVGDKVEAEDLIDLSKYSKGATAEFVEGYELDTTHASKGVETVILVSIPGDMVEMVVVKVDVEDAEGQEGLEVHGFMQVGTSVVPDFANIFSDKPTAIICVDAKDSKTGLGCTVIRLSDGCEELKYPYSKASVLFPSWTVSSKDGKRSAGAGVEFSFIDQIPGKVGCMPVAVGSYKRGSWTIEGKYFHDFREGKDMNAVRLGITKGDIGDILSLTGQLWYKSDYVGKIYGRVIVDVNLGGGFGAQLSCIARDGKLTPTAGVIYKF